MPLSLTAVLDQKRRVLAAAPAAKPFMRMLVLEILRAAARPLSPAELNAALAARGHPARQTSFTSLLTHLVRTRILARPAHGQYTLAPSPSAPSGRRPPRTRPRRQAVPARR